MLKSKFFLWFLVLTSLPALADMRYRGQRTGRDLANRLDTIENERRGEDGGAISYFLTSGDQDDDLKYFHSRRSRMGIDLGMMIPFNDFQSEFAMSPALGVHFIWQAIDPFSFTFSYLHSSSPQKNTPSSAKLSINSVNVGATASFSAKRYVPFVKLEAAFYFNNVSFNDGTKYVTAGDDINITTVGLNAGLGIDFVVGRELSIGLDITYHYPVPKKLTLSNGNSFDLGSPFATAGIRVTF